MESETYPACRHHLQNSGERGLLLGLLRRILKRDSLDITERDPTLKVIYLGNVVTTWAKSEGCLERPASALWRNHSNGRGSIKMVISVTPSGLKAQTAEHGLTEYWANRLTWTGVPADYPKLFCWIYRHEGRKLKQELRCHAVLCPTHERAVSLATSLRNRLAEALFDFRREKLLRQNARLSVVQSLYPHTYCGHVHSQNYKPPPEKARSAPKLTSIEENEEPPSPPPEQCSEPGDYEEEELDEVNEEQEEEEVTAKVSHEREDSSPPLEPSIHHHPSPPPPPPPPHQSEEEEEPSSSSLNLPSLNCYSKVMLHLLELPQMSESSGAEYPGSSNSDPVNDSSDSDSHDEFVGQEINDDNVSDESGYSEETVDPISSGGNSNNNNNNNNNSKPKPQIANQQPLALFDNLSFQI